MSVIVIYAVIVVLSALLALVSYVERLYTESGKFLSREFQENIDAFKTLVEPRLGAVTARADLAFAVLAQLTTAAIAILIGYLAFSSHEKWTIPEIAQAAVGMIVIVIVCNRWLPYVMFTRTRGEWMVSFVTLLRLLLYLMFPITLVLGFGLSVAALAESHEPDTPEDSAEAVDALIEAGREEGILEESDRQLIQSVVEFGDKTVREAMTPRPDVFAVPADTTVQQFIALMRDHPYSRVPVYVSTLDHIQGMVLAHDLLPIPDEEARVTMVRKLMRPVTFVPETKKTAALLREMQKDKFNLAVVIDEYGAVAGIVTLGNLMKEIVGEIHDEHEPAEEIIPEGDAYVVRGGLDIDRLKNLFEVRLEQKEATTVGGLVSALVGRIPRAGEVIEEDGLRFEILESTDRKIEKLRISRSNNGTSANELTA